MRISILIVALVFAALALPANAQNPTITRMWKGAELWAFAGPGGSKYQGSEDPKEWHSMPGVTLSFSYSGKGPLPAPREFVIPLEKPLPLGPPYRLFVKNFYRGKMEATLGDVTKPLEIRRFDWTTGDVFEPNQIGGIDKIVLRYFPSAMVADTGVAQTQHYIVQGVFLTTELKKVPIKAGEILETLAQEVPPVRAGNYLQNGSFETGLFPWGKPYGVSGAYGPENLDPATAAEGRSSFRRVLATASGNRKDGGAEAILESRNYALPPGTYTLSFQAKADRPVKLAARLAGASEDLRTEAGTALAVSANLTTEWKLYTVKAEVKALPSYLYSLKFAVESAGPATLWLDAVQLQNGEATKFQPASATEVGCTCAAPGHIFYAGEGSNADLLVSDASGAITATVGYRVTDYWGREIEKGEHRVPVADHHGKLAVTLPAKKTGLFRVLWTAGDSTSEMLYSVVPANPHLTSKYPEGTLGADTAFEEKQLAILKRANFNWVSSKSLARWSRIEREPGKFEFNDEALAAAERAQLMVLLQPLSIGREAEGGQPWLAPALRPPKGTGAPWTKKSDYLQAWGKFIYALVGHYGRTVKYWEIENEPNAGYLAAEYAELLQIAIDQARRADPEAKIVGFAGGGFQREYYDAGLRAIDPKRIDVFSLHVYGNGPADFAPFAALLQDHDKRGWNTETGLTCPTFFTTLPEHEALRTKNYWEDLQRTIRSTAVTSTQNYLRSMSEGRMEKLFYYFARFVNCGPSQPTARYGGGKDLVEFDGSLRANAVALCIASHFLDGAKYQGPVAVDERLPGQLFQQGAGSVGFLSTRADQPLVFTPPAGLAFFDLMGNRIEGEALRVTDSPVYFTSAEPPAKTAELLRGAKVAAAGT
ncbi:MAG TPA: hypothetical protein VGO11_02600, partial [Chthoniobacteraceae bacterium]|nr:hypothetical protein [Chthoniobacteraceae bacterium]